VISKRKIQKLLSEEQKMGMRQTKTADGQNSVILPIILASFNEI
jgi:hypothetical protein